MCNSTVMNDSEDEELQCTLGFAICDNEQELHRSFLPCGGEGDLSFHQTQQRAGLVASDLNRECEAKTYKLPSAPKDVLELMPTK
mmetsp:Transcript_72230/g.127263  ORF Transcript_72230/g.127263 Transcript_72230/m.127263 type:complete len:85 (-) Transcript_72230:259-513(-)